MKQLVKFELLKILRRKSTGIVVAVSLLLTAVLFGLPILQYQTYNQEGVIKGLSGIAFTKEQYAGLPDLLTEAYITDTVGEYQRLFDCPDNLGYNGTETFLIGDAYWDFVAPREKLLSLIASAYDAPGEHSGYQKLPDLEIENGAGFYQAREEKVEALLSSPSRQMSDGQKEYWRQMNSKVHTPFSYGYYEGWEIIFTSFELLLFGLLAICIVLAPVFSGEYQAGTDAVILAGKYGKTKLITAKIVSSLVFGTLAFALHAAVACGLPLAAFGAQGWNLPLQIAGATIPYPLTFLQATLINLGVIYLVLLGMIGLTLLLSARMKSPYLVLIVLVPILFFPMFLAPTGTTGAYNLTLFLLPYRATIPEIGKYISYQLGGVVLDAFTVRACVYAVLAAVTLPLARLGFRNRQVSA